MRIGDQKLELKGSKAGKINRHISGPLELLMSHLLTAIEPLIFDIEKVSNLRPLGRKLLDRVSAAFA